MKKSVKPKYQNNNRFAVDASISDPIFEKHIYIITVILIF